jgi:endonuclease IV
MMECLLAIQKEVKAMMEACLEMLEASQKKLEIKTEVCSERMEGKREAIQENIGTVMEHYERAPRIKASRCLLPCPDIRGG